jgi:hypothetical protein
MLTDLETLAEQMRLPAGGIALVLWADEAPRLLVRARGGFSMDHIPLKAAFEQGLVECSASPATATTMTVARAPLPNQDVLLEDNRLRGVDAPAIESGSACTLLEVKAKVEGDWKVVGRRLLNGSHEMTRRLAEQVRSQPNCEVNLLQGPRPQFVGKCDVALAPGILDHLAGEAQ